MTRPSLCSLLKAGKSLPGKILLNLKESRDGGTEGGEVMIDLHFHVQCP